MIREVIKNQSSAIPLTLLAHSPLQAILSFPYLSPSFLVNHAQWVPNL